MKPKLSFVLVHYNANNLIEKAITSIFSQSEGYTLEFLITDNSQNLNTTSILKQGIDLKVFDLGFNAGFAKGVNTGMKNASGDFIFVVNQDAFFFEENTIGRLLNCIESTPTKTVLGCRVVDLDNAIQESVWIDDPDLYREWRMGPIYNKLYPHWHRDFEYKKKTAHEKTGYTYRINGAFFILRNDINVTEAFFDEDFFLYGEDVEWGLRLKKRGWRFFYTPSIAIKHIGSASTNNIWSKTLQIIVSDWLAIRKTRGRKYLALLFLLIIFNKVSDLFLLHFALFRGKKMDKEQVVVAKQYFYCYFYLLNKYALLVLFSKVFFYQTVFVLNCYKNDIDFAQKNIKAS